MLLLRNGLQIRHGEDLVPVLAETSIAGRAARHAERLERRASMWKKVFWASLLGSVALGAAGLDFDNDELLIGGVVLLVAGGGAGAIGVMTNGLEAKNETDVVFGNYNDGLARRLNICSSGWAIVPCEGYGQLAPQSPPPYPTAPAPAGPGTP